MFKTLRLKLVGCNFQSPSVEPKPHDVVKIKLERDNKFDKDAIAVFNHKDEKIGYVGTAKTVSEGNRRNGCIDNLDLKSIVDLDNDDYLAIITKFREYFGFIDITVDDI